MNKRKLMGVLGLLLLILLLAGCGTIGGALHGVGNDFRALKRAMSENSSGSPSEQQGVVQIPQQIQGGINNNSVTPEVKLMTSKNIAIQAKAKMIVEADCDGVLYDAFVQNNKPSGKMMRKLYGRCPQLQTRIVPPVAQGPMRTQ